MRKLFTVLVLASCLTAVVPMLGATEEEPKPFPDLARTIGLMLRSEYFDESRFHPVTMLKHGLRALESAEISIDARLDNDELLLRLGSHIDQLPYSPPTTLEGTMRYFDRIRTVLERGDWSPQRRRELVYTMLNGALQTLDPHTLILPPKPADDFAVSIKGEFFGIGAFLNSQDGIVKIERVMPGMPADIADLRDGDLILRVDGERTVGLSLSQVVNRIKGPKNTTVVLNVEREGVDEPFDIPIVRDRVAFITLRPYLHAGDIGYVRMDEFNRHTALDLFKALRALEQQAGGELRGFVLDLRFNSGGLLEQARMISDFFLAHSKEIVRTVSSDGAEKKFHSSRTVYCDVPMAVIVGPGSASAAEILSGSLQLNDRAVVVGRTSFGKGSVQIIRTLMDDSHLKYTTQEYQLSGGASIQGHGVDPDIALWEHQVLEDGRVDLLPYSNRSEGDDEFALLGHDTYQNEVAATLKWLRQYRSLEQMREHQLSNPDFTPDQQGQMVLELVAQALQGDQVAEAGAEAFDLGESRQFLLQRLLDPVADRQEVESRQLASALAAAPEPVVWGAAGAPAADQLQVRYIGPEQVTAGQEVALTFAIANRGENPVGRLYGLVMADNGSPYWEEELLIGEVPAGGSVERAIDFRVPPRIYTGEERFSLHVFQHGSLEPLLDVPVSLRQEAQPRPRFDYAWELVEEAVPDGRIALDEDVTIRLRLRNSGAGDAVATHLYVFKDDDYHLQLKEGRFKFPPIAAGEEVVADVPIRMRRTVAFEQRESVFDGDQLTLLIRAEERFPEDEQIDSRYRATFYHELTLPVAVDFTAGQVRQPDLTVVERQVADAEAHLRVRVDDDNLRFLTVFLEEDKIALIEAGALADDGSAAIDIPLEPGLNRVRVLATDADETSEAIVWRVWGPSEKEDDAGATVARERPAPPADAIP